MSRTAAFPEWQRPFVRRVSSHFIVVLIMFYLGFHAISGERGLLALFTESRHLEALKAELAEVTFQREALEKKVQGLSNSSLDLDLLDEQSRRVLGMGGKDEMVVFTK